MEIEIKYKTVEEIVNETVEYYSKNPRSYNDSRCLYKGPNGAQCAFRRVVKPEIELTEGFGASECLWQLGDSILLPEYSLPNMDGWTKRNFYISLQSLHDDSTNWICTTEGQNLSPLGLDKVRTMIVKYSKS